MRLLSLDLEEPVAAPLPKKVRGVSIVFGSTNLSRGSVPGRGLLYSFLIHEIALFSLVSYYSYRIFTPALPRHPEEFRIVNLHDMANVLYLPTLGGGKEGVAQAPRPVPRRVPDDQRVTHRGPKLQAQAKPVLIPQSREKEVPAPPPRATPGLNYPGPQAIVSDVPKPTNSFQTILQPELKTPPIIKSFVPLPNIVQIAQAAPPPPPIVNPKLVVPVVHLEPEKLPEAPKLKLPKTAPQNLPVMPAAKPPERPAVVPVVHLPPEKPLVAPKLAVPTNAPVNLSAMPAAKPPEPKASEVATAQARPVTRSDAAAIENRQGLASLLPTEGKDAHTLLALSPLPAPAEESVKVPLGEARGRFAISPQPGESSAKAQPGAKAENVSSSALRIGQDSGTAAAPASSQSGIANASAKGTPAEHLHDAALGGGAAAGIGPGAGAFPGISIQGGSLRGGVAASSPLHLTPPPPPLPRSYSLTIVSTSSSGGGLADFGVFRNERVYTVYLDMRQSVEDPATSWTLQYAILRSADAPTSSSTPGPQIAAANGPGQGAGSSPPLDPGPPPQAPGLGTQVVPPLPLVKEQPHLPLELAQKYQRRLIVVSAIINKEGKFEQILVKQSPNPELNGPLLEALNKWVFRPAEFNGQTVSVKALLGIPVGLPQ